jgi:hypothetical protein
MKEIEREIAATKNVIRLLYECRKIASQNDNLKDIESCNKDIETCKEHLRKLYEMREQKCFL